MVGSGKLLAIIFGFSYFVMTIVAVSSICQLSQQHARYENNITTIFKEILGFREAEKVFDAALAEVKALPEKIIRVNNISLGKQLNEMDIRSRELLIYAAKFLESLRELFHERQMKSVPRSVLRLNSELDYLMMAVLRDGSLPQKLGYSMEDLIQCLRSKELVSHTMDLFGPLRIKWQEQFVIGLKQYVYLQHITERIRLDLTRKPSESCVRGLNKLVIGCPHNAMQINHPPVDPDQRPSNGFRLQSGICGSFCSNVIRACLAEPFLLLSDGGRNDRIASKERDELIPWELFAEVQGAQKSQKSYVISTYEAVLTALNASYISELIRTGLKNTRMKKASLKPVLHIFCGQPGHPEKQLPRTVNTSDSAVGVNSFPKQTVTEDIAREQNKLTNKVKELSRQLSVLASKHLAPELFVRNVEKRFCNEDSYDKRGNQIACWNGMMFGRYDKPVPPFTVAGQEVNPERLSVRKVQRRPVSLGVKKEALQSDERSDTRSTRPLLSEQVLATDRRIRDEFDSPSSGFMYTREDFDFLPTIFQQSHKQRQHHAAVNRESVAQEDTRNRCLIDDEDCLGQNEDIFKLEDIQDLKSPFAEVTTTDSSSPTPTDRSLATPDQSTFKNARVEQSKSTERNGAFNLFRNSQFLFNILSSFLLRTMIVDS